MIQEIRTNIKLLSPYSCADLISKKSNTLTVIISGFGYSLDMPIFYYTQKLLENRDTDLLKIDFAYNKDEYFLKLDDKEQDYQFKKELNSIQNYLEKTTYNNIIFIGKSLGTTAIYNLLNSSLIMERTIAAVWITPASISKNLNHYIPLTAIKNLIIYGIDDKYSKDLDINNLKENSDVKILEILTSSHRLEHTNLKDTIKTLNNIMITLEKFLFEIFTNIIQ